MMSGIACVGPKAQAAPDDRGERGCGHSRREEVVVMDHRRRARVARQTDREVLRVEVFQPELQLECANRSEYRSRDRRPHRPMPPSVREQVDDLHRTDDQLGPPDQLGRHRPLG
jgi:hypothetical protein